MILRILAVTLILQVAFGDDESRCKFPFHKDSDKAMRLLRADNFVGKIYTTTGNNFTFTVGICTDVKNNSDKNICEAARQQKESTKEDHVIGRCNATQVRAGNDWAMIEYEDGDPYPHACDGQNRRTVIMITCNCSAGDGVLSYFEEELTRSNNTCFYMFELDSRLICQNNCSVLPVPTPFTPGGIVDAGGLSAGSIFLIIFFTIVLSYLFFGFIVKLCTGHYGIELIPNVYFWMNFFALVADGCDFVLRCGPYADSRLRIDGEFTGDTGFGTSTSNRRGPLTPPPSALPPSTPALSEASSGYQNFNSMKHQRPVSTTGSLTGEVGSLAGASTSDDTYLIQA